MCGIENNFNLANNLTNFRYCFELLLSNNLKLFLTSGDDIVELEDKAFMPNSNLNLIEAVFDDSAQNHIILSGMFEQGGIMPNMDLSSAEVIIFINTNTKLHHLCTYYCTDYIIYGMNFKINLESESIKYNKSLLQCFSETCRANFGDHKCKIDIDTFIYDIENIDGNNIKLTDCQKETGYFDQATIIFKSDDGSIDKIKVLKHVESTLILERTAPSVQKVNIIPVCDKKFATCRDRFKNAINFRGEPFIPNKIINIS